MKGPETKPAVLAHINQMHLDIDQLLKINADLKKEIAELKRRIWPIENLEDSYPVVLFFNSKAEAQEFIDLVQQAKPGMRMQHL